MKDFCYCGRDDLWILQVLCETSITCVFRKFKFSNTAKTVAIKSYCIATIDSRFIRDVCHSVAVQELQFSMTSLSVCVSSHLMATNILCRGRCSSMICKSYSDSEIEHLSQDMCALRVLLFSTFGIVFDLWGIFWKYCNGLLLVAQDFQLPSGLFTKSTK